MERADIETKDATGIRRRCLLVREAQSLGCSRTAKTLRVRTAKPSDRAWPYLTDFFAEILARDFELARGRVEVHVPWVTNGSDYQIRSEFVEIHRVNPNTHRRPSVLRQLISLHQQRDGTKQYFSDDHGLLDDDHRG